MQKAYKVTVVIDKKAFVPLAVKNYFIIFTLTILCLTKYIEQGHRGTLSDSLLLIPNLSFKPISKPVFKSTMFKAIYLSWSWMSVFANWQLEALLQWCQSQLGLSSDMCQCLELPLIYNYSLFCIKKITLNKQTCEQNFGTLKTWYAHWSFQNQALLQV